jgi:hypothetical protein
MGLLERTTHRHGVECLDKYGFRLRCEMCGSTWLLPSRLKGERLAPDYWACPRGCNT